LAWPSIAASRCCIAFRGVCNAAAIKTPPILIRATQLRRSWKRCCINLLNEAEYDVGVGEGSCTTKNAPNSHVVTFLTPAARSPKAGQGLRPAVFA